MMPHLAEQCWQRLGNHTLVADAPWPLAEAALLIDDTVTIAVQVNGKRRDELIVPRDLSQDDLKAIGAEVGYGGQGDRRQARQENHRRAAKDRQCRRVRHFRQ